MSASASAAGYLYACGRVRGRGAGEAAESKRGGVAVYPPRPQPEQDKPERVPRIEYRRRRLIV